MKYLFITDQPEIARYVEQHGVGRIFVDLEVLGKQERQAGRDTVISVHNPESIARIRSELSTAELMVRVNPLNLDTPCEVDRVLDLGADRLMLPMFRHVSELAKFCRLVRGRAGVVPLVETAGAMNGLAEVVRVDGVCDVHIGLNDLHLDLNRKFMFELLTDGTVDRMAEVCRTANMPFGIGGVATIGGGTIPGELVLGEHARLGSTATILSRSFHHRAASLKDLLAKVDFPLEIKKLNDVLAAKRRRHPDEITADHAEICRLVAAVVRAA